MKQSHILDGWAEELREMLAKPVPPQMPYCERCDMTFLIGVPEIMENRNPERSYCAEPGCGRLFGHALSGHRYITVWVDA